MRVLVTLLVVLEIGALIGLLAAVLALYDTTTIRGRIYYRLHLAAAWSEINGRLKAGDLYRTFARFML